MSTPPPPPLRFGPFVLDVAAAQLMRDGRAVDLRPKAYALLLALAQRSGELVTKDELLDTVWGRRFITEGVIKSVVGELREALGDDPKQPRWIRTVPRRGYRFVAATAAASPAALPVAVWPIGRDAEGARLVQAWQAALAGSRRVMLVSGEPGAGKSALIGSFAATVDPASLALGQCVEGYGRGEAYRPWLEALASLAARDPDLPALLRQVAPSWLAQLPWLQTEADRAALAAADPSATGRMPREMVTLLDRLGERRPLLLWLEDLHWSDHASAELLDVVARQRVPARLMVVASLRATEVVVVGHALADLRRELRLHRLAEEIALDGLRPAEVRALAEARFPGAGWRAPVVAALHAHTEGLPLHLHAVLDSLAADGLLMPDPPGGGEGWRLTVSLPSPLPVPDSLVGLFEKQLAALEPVQRELLEAAAVAGVEFDGTLLAQALQRDAETVQARCDGLVRGGRWLRSAGVAAPDGGPPTGRYRFGHALMQRVCYARCGAARRVALHGRLAAVIRQRHALRPEEVAAELAHHDEQALDWDAALPQYLCAAKCAADRDALHDLLALAERGAALVARCSDAKQRQELAFEFAMLRSVALGGLHGYTAPITVEAARQAMAAAAGRELDEHLINLSRQLWLGQLLGGHTDEALVLAEQTAARARASGRANWCLRALSPLYFSAFKCGAFERARQVLAESERYAALAQPAHASAAGHFADLDVERAVVGAMLDVLQGRPGAGLPAARAGVAGSFGAISRVQNGLLLGIAMAWRGDSRAVAQDAQAVLALVERQGLSTGAAAHRVLLHWAQGMDGDAAAALPGLRAALAELQADTRLADVATLHDLHAEVALRACCPDEAAAALDAAFAMAARSGERYALALLWLRRAAVAQQRADAAGAASAFEQAVAVAQAQGAAGLLARVPAPVRGRAGWRRTGG